MTLSEIDRLLQLVINQLPDPKGGLTDSVFRFALKITPMINVDLLVRNERGEHLLAWREDAYGMGWHIPGGIIRFNERIEERIAAVASTELTAGVEHTTNPVEVKQFFYPRGHFISLLYLCKLTKPVSDAALWHRNGTPRHGQISWRTGTPVDIYSVNKTYSDWLNGRSE